MSRKTTAQVWVQCSKCKKKEMIAFGATAAMMTDDDRKLAVRCKSWSEDGKKLLCATCRGYSKDDTARLYALRVCFDKTNPETVEKFINGIEQKDGKHRWRKTTIQAMFDDFREFKMKEV